MYGNKSYLEIVMPEQFDEQDDTGDIFSEITIYCSDIEDAVESKL
ncbi:MAG: hypothetical protein [Wendovervirus sonii]|uniref:Uncharacterized protein n=1 Tax=phage Lak_Megaphage_Sonny TaxID=3109229 RepID=A0ABZ0Z404_9CAUD|nr:MAG: hypothetical protein [phage Lak_Megaphage_Sonny]